MTIADTIGRESSRPMRTSTRYWYLAPPLFLQCFPILYRETPVFKPRFMPILLAATHHMKSASPKLCCWSISKEKNFSWKDICLSCLQPVWANIQTVFAIAGSGAELQLKKYGGANFYAPITNTILVENENFSKFVPWWYLCATLPYMGPTTFKCK